MKKALVLGLALVVLATMASAATKIGIGAPVVQNGLYQLNPSVVIGLDQIDIWATWASKSQGASPIEAASQLAIGGAYYVAKKGPVSLGVMGQYLSQGTNVGAAKASDNTTSVISIGLTAKAALADGVDLRADVSLMNLVGGKALAADIKDVNQMGAASYMLSAVFNVM
jgi:hypothetical protein